MPKFKLDSDLLSENHKTRQIAVAIQTRRNQRRALDPKRLKRFPRFPNWFRSVHSRAVRFSSTV